MNYINIVGTQIQSLNININLTDQDAESSYILWSVYADGNDTVLAEFNNAQGNANVVAKKYYHELKIRTLELSSLKDETQYSLVGVLFGEVLYRGKFQTTQKSTLDYSINEDVYVQKTTATNYTILE